MDTRFVIEWKPEDVLRLRPNWTVEQAADWLCSNWATIRDHSENHGRELMRELLY